jgi:hypothetical protein
MFRDLWISVLRILRPFLIVVRFRRAQPSVRGEQGQIFGERTVRMVLRKVLADAPADWCRWTWRCSRASPHWWR